MKTSQDAADSLDKATHYSFCLCNIYLHLSALPFIRVTREHSELCNEMRQLETSKIGVIVDKCFTIFKNYTFNEFYKSLINPQKLEIIAK